MFKNMLNMFKIRFSLTPQSALLIKAQETHDPVLPDMCFVRVNTPYGESIYIPGSSLKGVFRSTAEALLRTVGREVCNSVEAKEMCPALERKQKKSEKLPYYEHCDACKIFGSQDMASRAEFTDLMPYEEADSEDVKKEKIEMLSKYTNVRPGISINRSTGKVEHGPFEMEILTGGYLYGSLIVKNYELWQLGLLIYIMDMANEGLIKFGYAKSRGLGRVKIDIKEVEILQYGPLKNVNISGVGTVKEVAEKYKLKEEKPIDFKGKVEETPFMKRYKISSQDFGVIKDELIERWNRYLEGKL